MKQEGNNLQSNITADNVQETNLYVNSDIKQELDSFYDEYPEYETKVKQDNVENAVIVKTENVTISREAATVYNICSEKESHYLKKLYENHEIKDELVIGPTVVQAETVYIDNEHSLYTRTEPKDVIHNKISNAVHKSMQQVKVVISDKIYFCDICRKVFTSYNTIASHMSVHYSKKPCSYQVCKKNREMDSQIKAIIRPLLDISLIDYHKERS
ncbi:uncharacterized protein LOC113523020 isoform X2 [Galleria mellonella]|uniref:Uncharacterized protein LOC113523020 isoform X2 n=1 Tax=Galleria mellonella TaxID=7137 RepID=A0ABM3MR54_GALME|nr:uncharacterized protein LOC113523020 isoform X2 [Galleria mellonella]